MKINLQNQKFVTNTLQIQKVPGLKVSLESLLSRIIKVKVKLSLCFNWAPHYEDVFGSGAPHIPDLDTTWRWVVSFTLRPLYPQRYNPWYPLDRKLGGPQSWSGCSGEEKNSHSLPGLKPLIIQPVAQWAILALLQAYIYALFSHHHSLQSENGGSKVLQNVCFLLQHHTSSQPKTSRLQSPSPWISHISHQVF